MWELDSTHTLSSIVWFINVGGAIPPSPSLSVLYACESQATCIPRNVSPLKIPHAPTTFDRLRKRQWGYTCRVNTPSVATSWLLNKELKAGSERSFAACQALVPDCLWSLYSFMTPFIPMVKTSLLFVFTQITSNKKSVSFGNRPIVDKWCLCETSIATSLLFGHREIMDPQLLIMYPSGGVAKMGARTKLASLCFDSWLFSWPGRSMMEAQRRWSPSVNS